MSDALAPWLRAILRCPLCHATLTDEVDASGSPALACDGDCRATGRPSTYRIDDGIPVLLPDEARPRRDEGVPVGEDPGGEDEEARHGDDQ